MSNQPLLCIDNLSVIYKTDFETVHALNGVSLSLNTGETLGLVGETGAGKSTAALSVMRLLPKRSGHVTGGGITFDGVDILRAKEGDMRQIRGEKVSMIFQDPMTSLNPLVPVGDQIGEALLLHNSVGRTKVQMAERVDEILEMVGIPKKRRSDFPHQFSGGMKQRVVIAIALACQPKLLLADEPTTALDVTIQAQVLAMMNELKEQLGTAMLLITHDLGVVAQTCDRVAVMYAGQIIEQGDITDLFDQERHHPYTVGLFGSIPNLEEETDRLSPIDGLMPDPTDLPPGCTFHPRCPHAMPECSQTAPACYTRGSHQVLCHLFAQHDDYVVQQLPQADTEQGGDKQ